MKTKINDFFEFFEKEKVKKIYLKKWENIAKPTLEKWFFIIKSWILSIKKSTNWIEKNLWMLHLWDFFWIFWEYQNEIISCFSESEIYFFEDELEFNNFIKKDINLWLELVYYINNTLKTQLLNSKKIISINYEIQQIISQIKQINIKSILETIEKIKQLVWVDYIIYLEKHPVLDNFLTLKYDSRFKNKMFDLVFEKKDNFLDLQEVFQKANINQNDFLWVNKLNIWGEIYWYLIFWNQKTNFEEIDKKIFSSIASNLAWIIKKFLSDKDEKNKQYNNFIN